MGWIVTLVVGGIVGWLASLLMKTDKQMGLIGNVVVGIIGSSLGFWVAGALGIGVAELEALRESLRPPRREIAEVEAQAHTSASRLRRDVVELRRGRRLR